MDFTAKQISEYLQGEIEGDIDAKVNNIAKIEEAQKGDLAFLANPKYEPYLYTSQATIILIQQNLVLEKNIEPTLIRVPDPYQAFASLLQLYAEHSKPIYMGIDEQTFIHDSADIGQNPYIGAFSYIGKNVKIGHRVQIHPQCFIGDNVTIGNDTILYPGVKIYHQTQIGKKCIIHAGTVIGADGFGFAPQSDAEFQKIPQIGNVLIEDHVEIGSNSTIDRATMGSTIIRKGVKLDNLVQIGHNVEIKENTVIAAQTGVSGSTKIGKDCMVGGQVGFAGHLNIADNVKIGAQSGVQKSVKKEGTLLQGYLAFGMNDFQKSSAVFRHLPKIDKEVFQLRKEIEALKKELRNNKP